MKYEKVIQEAISDLWNNRSYGGYNQPPRKDFGPGDNTQRGYNFPYQSGSSPFPATAPSPDNPPDPAWPLTFVTQHTADSYTSLLEVASLLESALKMNVVIMQNEEKKEHLQKAMKFLAKILEAIQQLDAEINKVADMAATLPPVNPQQERDPNQISVEVPDKKK